MSSSFDRQILESIRTGSSQKVLALLYEEVLPKVRSYVLRNSGTEEDARDVFQDAVLAFYHQVKTGQFKDKYEVGGYLFAIARNGWITRAKRTNRMPTTELADYDAAESTNRLHDMMKEEMITSVREAMSLLGSPCQELLKHSVYEGLSLKEIMEKMSYASTNVAKTYVYRCKKKLMDIIRNNPKFEVLQRS